MNQINQLFTQAGVPFTLVKMLIPAFFAVLFLQSGFDKVLHYKGNLSYFKDFFKSSPLSALVVFLLPAITFLEISAGITSSIGVVALFSGNTKWAFWGLFLSAISLLSLFFGQRLAQDYAGSANMTGYFLLAVMGLTLLV